MIAGVEHALIRCLEFLLPSVLPFDQIVDLHDKVIERHLLRS